MLNRKIRLGDKIKLQNGGWEGIEYFLVQSIKEDGRLLHGTIFPENKKQETFKHSIWNYIDYIGRWELINGHASNYPKSEV